MPAKKRDIYGSKIYSETAVDPGCMWLLAVCIVCVLAFVGCFIYVDGFVLWGNIVVFLFSIVATIYFLHFSMLKISASTSAITVRYGIFKLVVPWEDIIDCHTEIFDYSAPGFDGSLLAILPIMRANGKLIFHRGIGSYGYDKAHEEGRQHVRLRLRRVEIKEFSFSTRKPQVLVDLIEREIDKQEKQETIV